jgi:hypothetical protein
MPYIYGWLKSVRALSAWWWFVRYCTEGGYSTIATWGRRNSTDYIRRCPTELQDLIGALLFHPTIAQRLPATS